MKPYYESEGIVIYHGDNLVVIPTLADKSIDLTVTSPPYDNLRTYKGNSTFDFEGIAKELFRVTKDGGVVVWVAGDATINGSETLTSFKQALFFKHIGFNVETMIYQQSGTGAKGSNYYYWQSFEYMFVFSKGQPKAHNRIADKQNVKAGCITGGSPKNKILNTRGAGRIIKVGDFGIRENIWKYAAHYGESTAHPAPFPLPLATDHILSWSNEGDTVLDCFAGSGTTGLACQNTGRKCIQIERELEYVEIAAKRLAQSVFDFT